MGFMEMVVGSYVFVKIPVCVIMWLGHVIETLSAYRIGKVRMEAFLESFNLWPA